MCETCMHVATALSCVKRVCMWRLLYRVCTCGNCFIVYETCMRARCWGASLFPGSHQDVERQIQNVQLDHKNATMKPPRPRLLDGHNTDSNPCPLYALDVNRNGEVAATSPECARPHVPSLVIAKTLTHVCMHV